MNYVNYKKDGRIAFITLNRPEKRNALNSEIVEELKEYFDKAETDKEIKIVILKAKGEAFCAGADLAYLQTLQNNTFEENLIDSGNLTTLYNKIYTHDKIVIAQVEGHAIAGGAGLATVCDFAFSVPETKYGYTEVAIGFIPAIVSVFLLRKIGESKAKELLLTGKIIDAQEAKNLGIFNFIIEKKDISKAVKDFADNLIKNASGESLKITKKLIAKVQGFELDKALKYASKQNAKARSTDDCKKGISAFLNKEKINW
jgi:methylglutaconyl-CoA hydratase